METLDTEATPVASLRRALAVLSQIDPPADTGVTLGSALGSVPAMVRLHPRTTRDREEVFRRLILHGWTRSERLSRAMVAGVEVVLHDVRAGL